jgi:hypothetical protein
MYEYLQYKKVILAKGFMLYALSVREWGAGISCQYFLLALPARQSVSGNRLRYTAILPLKTRQGRTKRNR